jgi:hypothetical protein
MTAPAATSGGEVYAVRVNPILGGLHHEYCLAPVYT